MKFNLHVENFGKIENADIEVKPLTLLVGDNNGGKSYLLSLIWGLRNSDCIRAMFWHSRKIEHLPLFSKINRQITDLFDMNKKDTVEAFKIIATSDEFVEFFNELLTIEKDRFVTHIFNSDKINIDNIYIDISETDKLKIDLFKNAKDSMSIRYPDGMMVFPQGVSSHIDIVVREILLIIVNYFLGADDNDNNVYLPAARTGFVLSKSAINQYSRSVAYDIYSDKKITNRSALFTKPILHFLSSLESESVKDNKYKDIVNFIEENMSNGEIKYINEESKEIGYTPKGMNETFPLMITSALVTELAPLILILKNYSNLNYICYEEPEMCLHPKYQAIMARVLINLVNKNINIIATTHSDIILQHINNMGVLTNLDEEIQNKIFEKFGFTKNDLIKFDNVNVYQMKVENGKTIVTKIEYQDNGFDVHTFTDALKMILKQSVYINKSMVGNNNVC